jgi:hypothetical protein
MPHVKLNVVINTLADARAGIPIVEGCTRENITQADQLTIGILESGMTSGRTSLMFILTMNDGTFKVAECSAAQFEMLIGAVRGAVKRFEGRDFENLTR